MLIDTNKLNLGRIRESDGGQVLRARSHRCSATAGDGEECAVAAVTVIIIIMIIMIMKTIVKIIMITIIITMITVRTTENCRGASAYMTRVTRDNYYPSTSASRFTIDP